MEVGGSDPPQEVAQSERRWRSLPSSEPLGEGHLSLSKSSMVQLRQEEGGTSTARSHSSWSGRGLSHRHTMPGPRNERGTQAGQNRCISAAPSSIRGGGFTRGRSPQGSLSLRHQSLLPGRTSQGGAEGGLPPERAQEAQPMQDVAGGNSLAIHRLEHLPRIQPLPVCAPPLGPRPSVAGAPPQMLQMPHPAARSPARILDQALRGGGDLLEGRDEWSEARIKRARIELPIKAESPERPICGGQGVGALSGQGQHPEGVGVVGGGEQRQAGRDRVDSPGSGGRPPLPPPRPGHEHGFAVQVIPASSLVFRAT